MLLHNVDQTKVDGTTFNAVVEILPSGQMKFATAAGVLIDHMYSMLLVVFQEFITTKILMAWRIHTLVREV